MQLSASLRGLITPPQPEKRNQKLCGVESSPFCLFAVGFLSTTPTCHSHRVTSRSCLLFGGRCERKKKRLSIYFGLKFKMLNICARNRHMILMTDGLKNNNREKNTSCLLMSLVPPLFSLCDCYIHPHYTGKANSGIQPPLHANTEEPEKPET